MSQSGVWHIWEIHELDADDHARTFYDQEYIDGLNERLSDAEVAYVPIKDHEALKAELEKYKSLSVSSAGGAIRFYQEELFKVMESERHIRWRDDIREKEMEELMGELRKAKAENARLGAEVEELMKVDYWQDRHNILKKDLEQATKRGDAYLKECETHFDTIQNLKAEVDKLKNSLVTWSSLPEKVVSLQLELDRVSRLHKIEASSLQESIRQHDILEKKYFTLQLEVERLTALDYAKEDQRRKDEASSLRLLAEAYRAKLVIAEKALRFYSGIGPENEVIEWGPHVCDSYSGRTYAPDWNGDLQDEPGDIAIKALSEIKEARAALGDK